ncbi:MAG: radical SAM protein [Deltaproteobacteria bacterium]|nr:radical SAM protein [Deltaproteobacteria bacterium]
MNITRHIAFGYSTRCNIKCDHCVAAHDGSPETKMTLDNAVQIIEDMSRSQVTGISFTAGEPFLYLNEMKELIQTCKKQNIYSRIVTNGYWGKTRDHSNEVVSALKEVGLSQLRISFSRWHQKNVSRKNILNAALSCQRVGLDYFISFVTDFKKEDDAQEQFLQDNQLKYFPEPLIYFGNAARINQPTVFTDYPSHRCAMNPYLSPEMDMFACCDAGTQFTETDAFYLGNLKSHSVDHLFQKKEKNLLFHLIKTMGLTAMASFLGFKASEIVKYRKCNLCEALFNSTEHLERLKKSATTKLLHWTR